jgi:Ser/Thr protein kinase RdoA (MazF antagonist)
MKEFDELTKPGRSGRLRRHVASLLASEYGLAITKVFLLSAHSVNTLFLCEIVDGARVVLRVGPPQSVHPPGSEALESIMLATVTEEAQLSVPTMLPTTSGELTSSLVGDFINGPRICSLFTFVQGKPIAAVSVETARSLGILHATVHTMMHEAFTNVYLSSDEAFEMRSTLFFHNRNTLYTYESEHGSMFREAIDRVQLTVEQLWREQPHTPYAMHGDFGFHNVLQSGGQIFPIDFQDCFIGFDVQDLGISLADFRRPTLVPFRDAYLAGYSELRPLPEMPPTLLDTFTAQRILNVMNLQLNLAPHGFVGYIDQNVEWLRAWART